VQENTENGAAKALLKLSIQQFGEKAVITLGFGEAKR
jgi:hypothetical protein